MSNQLPNPSHEPPEPDWLATALRDKDVARSQAAARELLRLESPGPAIIARLTEALADPEASVRRRAANVIGQLGARALAAKPALAQALGDLSWTVREAAVRALGAIDDGEPRPALVRATLSDRNRLVRDAAARVLARSTSNSEADLKGLRDGLAHPHASVRCRALRALSLWTSEQAEIVSALVRALHDSHRKVRRNAATALARFGRSAASALPELIKHAHESEPMVREASAGALARIAPTLPESLRARLEALTEPVRSPEEILATVLARSDLGDTALHEFVALCRRRALWQSRRAGLDPGPPIDSTASALEAALAVLGEAQRVARQLGADGPEAGQARADETAWLLSRLAGWFLDETAAAREDVGREAP